MFLRERSTQAEYCDRPDLSSAELRSVYRQLARLHRLARSIHLLGSAIARVRGIRNVQQLTLLDLGAGDGSIGQDLEDWARTRGWKWTVTSLDSNPRALEFGTAQRRIAGDACALPFNDASFDVVFASQMTHHLSSELAAQHFAEAWRVTSDVLYLLDAHRNALALLLLNALLQATGFSREFRSDAVLSVKRGWRVREWQQLAAQAQIANAAINVEYASRIVLLARKPGVFGS